MWYQSLFTLRDTREFILPFLLRLTNLIISDEMIHEMDHILNYGHEIS